MHQGSLKFETHCKMSARICDGNSYLYWADGTNVATAKIERSDLAGNGRVQLVSPSHGVLVLPVKLVVDFGAERLYWLDAAASTVGSVNFDGSDLMKWQSRDFGLFSAMTFYGVTV